MQHRQMASPRIAAYVLNRRAPGLRPNTFLILSFAIVFLPNLLIVPGSRACSRQERAMFKSTRAYSALRIPAATAAPSQLFSASFTMAAKATQIGGKNQKRMQIVYPRDWLRRRVGGRAVMRRASGEPGTRLLGGRQSSETALRLTFRLEISFRARSGHRP